MAVEGFNVHGLGVGGGERVLHFRGVWWSVVVVDFGFGESREVSGSLVPKIVRLVCGVIRKLASVKAATMIN